MKLKETYTADEFDRLIRRENEEIELKSGLGKDPLQESMVAFSNAGGGVIFIGVR